ncbi:class A beta-lactamase-related serine hydrolase [Aeromicrobium phragmitis]|uniref:Class A beta-lactamase-related serine hydrolase n=1 Tax=Aeromicrobium phragmitis TaxID=2478914 RepID=A0A3L8PIL5_9ACTN|nr:serine hydrolase domain-containing protein [Aeromicrobium phragmitis]RLV54994.1 class A beta-lactamase-related serine hydrolase [Aeromicrobium phragmitis]
MTDVKRRQRLSAVAALLLVVALAACGQRAHEEADVAELFAAELTKAKVPGGALAVRVDDTLRVYPVGEADEGSPVTEETLFAYRSVTKSFVVTAALTLVEEGLLELEAPTPAPEDGVNPAAATLRQLAAMRSGVPNYSAQPGLIDALSADPERSWSDADLFGLVRGQPETFAPGTSYQYSNTNTLLLARAIEQVTGGTWAQAVVTTVTEPLGLESVRYPGDAGELPAGAAEPFEVADEGVDELPVVRASAFGASGGLFGTVGDLASWAQALGTGAVLTPATQEARLEAFGPTDADPQSPLYDAYGLGIGRIGDWIGHTGNGLGYQALAMYHPEAQVAVAITLNATGDDQDLPAHLLQRLEDVLLAH